MKIIKSPNNIIAGDGRLKIFLSGSIEMGKADDWQERIAGYLSAYDIDVLNPRRDNWDSSWVQSINNPYFKEQVEWELNGLNKSDIIALYFDSATKSPISLLELGLFANSAKIITYCPQGFWRKGNVDIVCELYGIPIFDEETAFVNFLKKSIERRF